jgi:hypothetical protein
MVLHQLRAHQVYRLQRSRKPLLVVWWHKLLRSLRFGH